MFAPLLLGALLAASALAGPIVQTTNGPVEGIQTDSARVWLGIPYAAPPVGNLRWKQSVPPARWNDTKDCTAFQPACPQHCELPPAACQAQISEDCLTLNIFAPLTPGPHPVMVWIHGGRYQQGSEGVELYDGRNLAAETNTVIVTVNYRLGVLGFLTLDAVSGNFGVLDQRLAMTFVQANIAAFGGNPGAVTIFGQSAGATSVAFHLTAAGSFPLFSQAILQSSPFGLPIMSKPDAIKHYGHFVAETGCAANDMTCLLGLTWDQVVVAQIKAQQKVYVGLPLSMFYPWVPHVDGVDLTSDPLTMMQQGKFHHVPIILGHVTEEAYMFIYDAFAKPVGSVEADALVAAIFRSEGLYGAINKFYPKPENKTDLRDWLSVMASDYLMVCSGRNATNIFAAAGLPVFRYAFDHVWSIPSAWGPIYPYCGTHVCHGSELPFVFDSANLAGYNFTAPEVALSVEMSTVWGAFAHSASPNAPGFPAWPPHTASANLLQWFATNGTTAVQDPRLDFCRSVWDKFGYTQL